ncbi:MAG: MFS transporter [Bacteroidota bacterium]
MDRNRYVLPIIVLSQFFCTSLWFAGNGVINDLIINFNLEPDALAHLTSSVQFGFIIGTLVFAVLAIADRFSPSKVFMVCAILGALFNLGLIWEGNSLETILGFRFLTGFFLAGIYPVGMKIAADYFDKGLGKSLGYLVGALVVGTAFPHLLRDLAGSIPWRYVLITISGLATIGGLMMFFTVPDGPFRKKGQEVSLSSFFKVFDNRPLRSSSFGYWGHMWELYTFWAFVPIMLESYNMEHSLAACNIPLWSFIIIGIGGLACIMGGYLAYSKGTKKIAFWALLLSCLCCLLYPLVFTLENQFIYLAFLLFWGAVVIADSPLFSTLVAQSTTPHLKGTALTIVNCIGFSITIISIQLVNFLWERTHSNYIFMLLAIGPLIGLMAIGSRQAKRPQYQLQEEIQG